MVLQIITVLMLAAYAVLIGYYRYHWRRLAPFELTQLTPSPPFISVVIAARNEEATLPHLLKALQEQTYPAECFEVIVADDFSTDGTANIVHSFSGNIRTVQPAVDPLFSSKKKAVEAGVKAARGSLIVITDADCLPQPEWLQLMAAFHMQKGALFIAAPVKFVHNNSWLQVFQSIDFLTLQGITAASVSAGFHSMCNGANLAYTKAAFEEVDGFAGIDVVASGDDMLLMHKIKKKYPAQVRYLKNKDAIINTKPMTTWKDFVMQRRRWASKTAYYDDKAVLYVLLFVYGFNCLFLVLAAASFFNLSYLYVLAGYLVLKTMIEWPFVKAVSEFYNEEALMKYFPLLQPLHILYTISVGFLSQLGKYKWKGRKVK